MGVNLTNKAIQDTYEGLVQISGSLLTDGTGSLIDNLDITASSATFATTASFAVSSSADDLTLQDITDNGATTTNNININSRLYKGDGISTNQAGRTYTILGGTTSSTLQLQGNDNASINSIKLNPTTGIQLSGSVDSQNDITAPSMYSTFVGDLQGNADTATSASYATTASLALALEGGVSLQSVLDTGNTATEDISLTGKLKTGGSSNTLTATNGAVVGGDNHNVSGVDSANAGGNLNTIAGDKTFVGGGSNHSISAGAGRMSIIGGQQNSITAGEASAIVGGFQHTLSSTTSAIVGGRNATNSHLNSVVIGGDGLSTTKDNEVVVPSLVANSITASFASFESASIGYLQSITGSAKIIGDAFIILNNDTPTERYAGIVVQDSGSTANTASLEFDGQTNDWFYEYTDDGGATTEHGVALFGAEYSTKGSPVYPTANTIQKGDGGHHLLDSRLTDDGITLTYAGSKINFSNNNGSPSGTRAVVIGGFVGNATGLESGMFASSFGNATGQNAVVIGGVQNENAGFRGATLGGGLNTITTAGRYGAIVGGRNNTAQHQDSVVIGGDGLSTSKTQEVVVPHLTISGSTIATDISASGYVSASTFIGDGSGLTGLPDAFPYTGSAGIQGSLLIDGTLVSGDTTNVASGTDSVSIGGEQNTASALRSVVLSGFQNANSGTQSVIAGGSSHLVSATNSGIFAGENSEVSGAKSVVAGGEAHIVVAERAGAFAGWDNRVNGNQSATLGGGANSIGGQFAVILGGEGSNVASNYCGVLAGAVNTISNADTSVIMGGYQNSVQGIRTSILNGYQNTIQNTGVDGSTIIGGQSNTIPTGISQSAIIAGEGITADASDTLFVPNLHLTGSKGGELRFADGTIQTTSGTQTLQGVLDTGNEAQADMVLTGSLKIGDGGTHYNAINIETFDGTNSITGDGNSQGTIAIGEGNTTGKGSSISIGRNNQNQTFGNGQNNVVIGLSNDISAGNFTSNNYIFGTNLSITGNGSNRTLIGGNNNDSPAGARSGIFAGENNTNGGDKSVILGGDGATINNNILRSAIIGGENNTINGGQGGVVIGGINNFVSHNRSVVLGGNGLTTIKNDEVVVKHLSINGAVVQNVEALTISANVAELDASLGNMFTLGLANGVNTELQITNQSAGQTFQVKITNNATSPGTITFDSQFDFEGGTAFTATPSTNAVDILTFTCFDGGNVQCVSAKNFS